MNKPRRILDLDQAVLPWTRPSAHGSAGFRLSNHTHLGQSNDAHVQASYITIEYGTRREFLRSHLTLA